MGVGTWQAARLILGPAVVVDRVGRGNLVETVVASGHVETPFRVKIGSQITGTVRKYWSRRASGKQGQPWSLWTARAEGGSGADGGCGGQGEASSGRSRADTAAGKGDADPGPGMLVDAEATHRAGRAIGEERFRHAASLDAAIKESRRRPHSGSRRGVTGLYPRPGGSAYVVAETQLNQGRANLETARLASAMRPCGAARRRVHQPAMSSAVRCSARQRAPRAGAVWRLQLVLQIDEQNLGLMHLGQNAVASADAYADRRFAARSPISTRRSTSRGPQSRSNLRSTTRRSICART